jgi:hypothetical protein
LSNARIETLEPETGLDCSLLKRATSFDYFFSNIALISKAHFKSWVFLTFHLVNAIKEKVERSKKLKGIKFEENVGY